MEQELEELQELVLELSSGELWEVSFLVLEQLWAY